MCIPHSSADIRYWALLVNQQQMGLQFDISIHRAYSCQVSHSQLLTQGELVAGHVKEGILEEVCWEVFTQLTGKLKFNHTFSDPKSLLVKQLNLYPGCRYELGKVLQEWGGF